MPRDRRQSDQAGHDGRHSHRARHQRQCLGGSARSCRERRRHVVREPCDRRKERPKSPSSPAVQGARLLIADEEFPLWLRRPRSRPRSTRPRRRTCAACSPRRSRRRGRSCANRRTCSASCSATTEPPTRGRRASSTPTRTLLEIDGARDRARTVRRRPALAVAALPRRRLRPAGRRRLVGRAAG